MEKKDKYVYPAIFEYNEDGIAISFPDLDGCFTCAKDDESALHMAKDALAGHMWAREDFGEEIPEPTQLKDMNLAANERGVLIDVYMPLVREAARNQSVKKTLTIPAWMNEAAEKEGINFSQLLQNSLLAVLKASQV